MSLVVRWQVPTTSFDRLQSLNRQAYTGCRPVTAGVIDRPLRPLKTESLPYPRAVRPYHARYEEAWSTGRTLYYRLLSHSIAKHTSAPAVDLCRLGD